MRIGSLSASACFMVHRDRLDGPVDLGLERRSPAARMLRTQAVVPWAIEVAEAVDGEDVDLAVLAKSCSRPVTVSTWSRRRLCPAG